MVGSEAHLLGALAEDLDLVPGTYIGQRAMTRDSSSGGSDILFWLSQAPAHIVT